MCIRDRLQICAYLGKTLRILYVSGEESEKQIKMRRFADAGRTAHQNQRPAPAAAAQNAVKLLHTGGEADLLLPCHLLDVYKRQAGISVSPSRKTTSERSSSLRITLLTQISVSGWA